MDSAYNSFHSGLKMNQHSQQIIFFVYREKRNYECILKIDFFIYTYYFHQSDIYFLQRSLAINPIIHSLQIQLVNYIIKS